MIATIDFVEEKVRHFNREIFGNRLPPLPVRLSDAATFLGMCVAKIRHLPDGRKEHYDFELRISLRHDLPEREMEDTIIHEMIHYFIMYNELVDTSPHGEIFKAMMRSINRHYGRNITISRRLTADEKVKIAESKRKWHVIALIRFRNGSTGVKILPRVVPKVIDYYNTLRASAEVREAKLFLHDNPFFNRFPVSVSFRVHQIDYDLLAENLNGAHNLLVENGKLVQR